MVVGLVSLSAGKEAEKQAGEKLERKQTDWISRKKG